MQKEGLGEFRVEMGQECRGEKKIWRVDSRIKKINSGGLIPSPEIGDFGSSSQLMLSVCDVDKKDLMYW